LNITQPLNLNMTTENIECAICLDNIDFTTNNCVKTECGHSFHTSCLMRNVAHNGFGCPYCREEMAEAVEDSDDEYEEGDEEVEMFDDDALRGFRLFMDNVEGVPHEDEDLVEEEEAEDRVELIKPPAAFITQKLVEQGVTMEDLVKILLRDHEEYDAEDPEFDTVDEAVWEKMRVIISNYQPEEPAQPASTVPEVDYESQPKIHPNVTVRRIMTHI